MEFRRIGKGPLVVMEIRITGGDLRGRIIHAPTGPGLRPMMERVRSAVFSILGSEVLSGARVLDLFAGTGAIGMEALSRGAVWVDFVEANVNRVRAIKRNLCEFSLSESSHVYRLKVGRALRSVEGPYDIILADPPFDLHDWDSLMNSLGGRGLLAEQGLLIVEHSTRTELSEGYGRLKFQQTRQYGDAVISIYDYEANCG